MASLKSVLTLDRLFVIRGPAMAVHLNLSTARAVGSGERTDGCAERSWPSLQRTDNRKHHAVEAAKRKIGECDHRGLGQARIAMHHDTGPAHY